MLLLTLTMRSLEPRQFLYLEQREPAVLVDGPRLLEAAAPDEPVFAEHHGARSWSVVRTTCAFRSTVLPG